MNRQEYLITTLAAELGEASQACMKALRFGLQDRHPIKLITNAHAIEVEIMEALAVRDMLREIGSLSQTEGLAQIYASKKDLVMEWEIYSRRSCNYTG